MLTRAMAIVRHLKADHLIYANSYIDFAREKGFNVRRVCKGAIEDFASMGPAVVVTDTWPYGDRRVARISARHIFIARKCNGKRAYALGFEAVIDPHDAYILIRQPEEWLMLAEAQAVIGDDYPVLAFHAGIWAEERERIFREARVIADDLGKRLVIMTPRDYWPICELLPAAGHAVCAAGYNAFAETKAWSGPTTYIPQGRNYDDQWDRLNESPIRFDGAMRAAEIIDGRAS